MADMTVRVPQGYPVGTTLSVYVDRVGDIIPQGTPVSTCVVAADSTALITGITPQIPYQVGAIIGGAWRGFLVEMGLPVPTDLSSVIAELAAHEADSTDVHGAAGTLASDAELLAVAQGVGSPSTQTGNYTLALADAGKTVEQNLGTPTTVTVPPNSSVAFPIGTIIEVARYGAGTVAIAAGAGVTIRSRGGLLSIGNQYG